MKSYKEIRKKYKPEELAEAYIFPDDLTAAEKKKSVELFRDWRRKNEERRTPKDKRIAGLLQLKFQLEDYLKEAEFRKGYDFSFFLRAYINSLDIKKKDFAAEIAVEPAELSQILNKHRSPNEVFFIRLELHSNKSFPAIYWSKLIEKEKTFELQHNTALRLAESKHVKSRVDFSI